MGKFEETIGYHFEDARLMRLALTHSSYANEHMKGKLENNERLEFLGDAVLEIVSSDFLFHAFPEDPEGKLTRRRASLVCEPTLAICARELGLGDHLLLGKGEDATGGRKRDSILSDALEALIGAIYLDGGFTNAKEFIHRHILNDLEHKRLFFDSKTILQEMVQKSTAEHLHYELIGECGPDHDKEFSVKACIGDQTVSEGKGRTKKAAEQQAAYAAILKLREKQICI
ncbi:MAG: ribonuclease III [Lachnospiraceae bacterium]|nr:ribonuclease III [Lachnospiraceae bacterium]